MKKIYTTFVAVLAIIQFSYGQTTYSLIGANASSAQWVKIGTLTLAQGGRDAWINIVGGSGYNADYTQQGQVNIHLRTSDGSSVDGAGFGFSVTAASFNPSGVFVDQVKVVPNASGVSATAYYIYGHFGPYVGSSFYTVQQESGSWTNAATAVGSDPGGYVVRLVQYVNYDALFTGAVGIDTQNPQSVLQVGDKYARVNFGPTSGTSVLNWGTGYLGFNASRTETSPGVGNWTFNTDLFNNGGGVIYNSVFGDMYFATVSSNAGSPQTLTDAQLTSNVNMHLDRYGTLYAKKIMVQTSIFPDYVFKPTYPLAKLADVKSYIDKNHHLPEMPTAEQVEKNGIDVSEMNKLLIKKVEELTLYLIEQNKRIAEQDKHIATQVKANHNLQKQISKLAHRLAY